MPRVNDVRAIEPAASQAIIGSAENFATVKSPVYSNSASKNSGWQDQAWSFYDTIGEFEYVANWVGNMLSRVRLTVKRNGVEVKDGPAKDALDELFGSPVGKSAALRMLGIQATVAGESFIIHHTLKGKGEWVVVAGQRVSSDGHGGNWKLDGKKLPDNDLLVIRSWNPHPRRADEATSPARAALPILNEILRLTQHLDSQLISRLKSAGILLLPNEMAVAASTDGADTTTATRVSAADFVKKFYQMARTAIADRGDASAVIPMVLTADAEVLDKARLLEFSSELDQQSLALRVEAIRRLGLAMDVPPEILNGTADTSHWQAWSVGEDAIKAHAEPLAMRLAGDLTEGYFWPALAGVEGLEGEPEEYEIDVDTSELRLRPNRSREAIEMFNLGLLGKEALFREVGFDLKADAITEPEFQAWLQQKVALQSIDSTASTEALRLLGLEVPKEIEAGPGNKPPYDPSLERETTDKSQPNEVEQRQLQKDAERKKAPPVAARVAVAEQMVFRALERAGNKAKSQLHLKPPEGVEPAEFYLYRVTSDAEASFMLNGAFAHCGRFAAQYGYNADAWSAALEEYCRYLLISQTPHSTERLVAALNVEESMNA